MIWYLEWGEGLSGLYWFNFECDHDEKCGFYMQAFGVCRRVVHTFNALRRWVS